MFTWGLVRSNFCFDMVLVRPLIDVRMCCDDERLA
jgi:hypothetical protein